MILWSLTANLYDQEYSAICSRCTTKKGRKARLADTSTRRSEINSVDRHLKIGQAISVVHLSRLQQPKNSTCTSNWHCPIFCPDTVALPVDLENALRPVGVSSVMTSQISAAHLMSWSLNGKASFGDLPSVVALIKIAPGLVDFWNDYIGPELR